MRLTPSRKCASISFSRVANHPFEIIFLLTYARAPVHTRNVYRLSNIRRRIGVFYLTFIFNEKVCWQCWQIPFNTCRACFSSVNKSRQHLPFCLLTRWQNLNFCQQTASTNICLLTKTLSPFRNVWIMRVFAVFPAQNFAYLSRIKIEVCWQHFFFANETSLSSVFPKTL